MPQQVHSISTLIEEDEGRIEHEYKDSLGYSTIGVGHLIDERKGGRLPGFVVELLKQYDIRQHIHELETVLPWTRGLDEVRHAVLVDMHFQLGSGLYDFEQTLSLVEAGKYDAAAEEMLDSTWAREQTPERAQRLSRMMRSGRWSSYYE